VAGLVLSYVIQLTGQFQWCVRQIVDMESKMTSTERLIHYINNLEVIFFFFFLNIENNII